jgi:outer membrane receptor protein involved in Fe transport
MNKLTFKVLSALFVAFFSLNVLAQSQTGTLTGSVQGATAGTVVVAVDTARGVERAVSAADGSFELVLAPGSYNVQVRNGGSVVDSQTVLVRLDSTINLAMATTAAVIDEIVVTGERIVLLDTGIAESGIVVTSEEIDALPIARNLTSVALLAPGATAGVAEFGGVAFSGSSVAENQTYINGLSTTNFRNGLGFGYVPFEMFSQMQAKTGAYGAQYGRSTGGVINAVTKSGSNDFRFGVNYNTSSPTSHLPDTATALNSLYERTLQTTDYWASGPIIRDRLFYYVLVQDYDYQRDSFNNPTTPTSGRNYNAAEITQFTGFKLDAYLTDTQRLEYTSWQNDSNYRSSTNRWSQSAGVGETVAYTDYPDGSADNWVFAYTGDFGPITLRYSMGQMQEDRSVYPSSFDVTPAYYMVGRTLDYLTDWSTSRIENGLDTRESQRFEIDLNLANHNITIGFENEDQTADNFVGYSGPNAELWYHCNLSQGVPLYAGVYCSPSYWGFTTAGDGLAMQVQYTTEGTVTSSNSAWYLTDTFNIGSNLTVEAGIRGDVFENLNALGENFITLDDQIAPRISLVYQGDSGTRYFANYGVYYLPIAANTNIRSASSELYRISWYDADTTFNQATQRPDGIDFSSPLYVYELGDGSVPDPKALVDQSIEPMYQFEYVAGVETQWNGLNVGVKGMVRKLGATIEDIIIDEGVRNYFAGNDTIIDGPFGPYPAYVYANYYYSEGTHTYALTNPGSDVVFYEGEFLNDFITIPAEMTGIPIARRTYKALEFSVNKPWDGRTSFTASYTLGRNYGNYEGWVNSVNGQDDAGITTLFDSRDMTRGSYGDLPNDIRHTLKVWGNYAVNDSLTLGTNIIFRTGAPKNCLGNQPGADTYPNAMFWCNGVDVPRGSQGRTPNYMNVDVNAQYRLSIANQDVILTAGVYNVLDKQEAMEFYNEDDDFYGQPRFYQSPRSVRLGFRYNFN